MAVQGDGTTWRYKVINGPRTKLVKVRLFSSTYHFSLRRFRTKNSNRSKRFTQIVLSVWGLPFKEVAVKRTQRVRRKQPNFFLAHVEIPLMLLGLIGGLFFSQHLYAYPNLEIPAQKSVNVRSVPKSSWHLSRAEPLKIRVPSLQIEAPLSAVGLNADGSLAVPADPWQAGWYKGAPTPGEIGPAVIVGHVDSVRGPAVFWRLRELQPGDIVEVDRADGRTARFKIDQVKQYPQASLPSQEIYKNINYAGIRVITCGGTFNVQTGHYSDNTVIFGHLVP